jgi:uncharacterized protein YjbI with pentapeptide repeats
MPIERFQMQARTMTRVNRLSDGVPIFEHVTGSQIDALEHAAKTGVDLSGADLIEVQLMSARLGSLKAAGANLSRACLSSVRLSNADLTGAVLEEAELGSVYASNARLKGANLHGARLAGAKLPAADLTEADLSDADLSQASLVGAKLDRAKLTGTDLAGADLTEASLAGVDWTDVDVTKANWSAARAQLSALLSSILPAEATALLEIVRKGKIGESGLVGTVAGMREFDLAINPTSVQAVERMCTGIKAGGTPATNPLAAMLADWIEEWLASPAADAAHRDLCPTCGQLKPKKAA